MRRTAAVWWAALGVAGVAAAVTVVVIARHDSGRPVARESDFGRGTSTRLNVQHPTAASTLPTATTTRPSSPRSSARVPSRTAPPRSALLPPTGRHHGPGPVSISIPAAGIRARVEPIGVDREGDVAIPDDVRTVGWYRFSPDPPSVQGSTVLVGHVDSAVQGQGAFFTLHTLGKGAHVQLRSAHGKVLTYRIVSRELFPKSRVPLDALFSTTGAPRLTLVTCGGSFDPTVRSYRDNVVVTAVPLDT